MVYPARRGLVPTVLDLFHCPDAQIWSVPESRRAVSAFAKVVAQPLEESCL